MAAADIRSNSPSHRLVRNVEGSLRRTRIEKRLQFTWIQLSPMSNGHNLSTTYLLAPCSEIPAHVPLPVVAPDRNRAWLEFATVFLFLAHCLERLVVWDERIGGHAEKVERSSWLLKDPD